MALPSTGGEEERRSITITIRITSTSKKENP